MNKDRIINFMLAGVIVCAAAVTVVSAGKVINIRRSYSVRDAKYESIAKTYTRLTGMDENYSVEQMISGDTSTSVAEKKAFPISVNFAELTSECSFGTVSGWLYSPDTPINYPVASCDDNFYYLYHLLDGTDNSSGTLYCDYRCARNFDGPITIVYGHHMGDGSMFATLANYYTQSSFYGEHPYLYLSTPTGNYKLVVFSAYSTLVDDEKTFAMSFNNDFTYYDYIQHLKDCNLIDGVPDVDVTIDDQVVLLVTCSYDYDNSRTVVACVKRPVS